MVMHRLFEPAVQSLSQSFCRPDVCRSFLQLQSLVFCGTPARSGHIRSAKMASNSGSPPRSGLGWVTTDKSPVVEPLFNAEPGTPAHHDVIKCQLALDETFFRSEKSEPRHNPPCPGMANARATRNGVTAPGRFGSFVGRLAPSPPAVLRLRTATVQSSTFVPTRRVVRFAVVTQYRDTDVH